ncbi:MAG: nitrite reductase/ring-hydroxylating ferredoxin subunit [bacterium]|jgi:nitrite reductase/ring-hydroxylating ferredoxin subunit
MKESWHSIIALSELEIEDVTQVNHDKLTLAVYDTKDGVFVSDARCTHAGANLCDGYFDGKNIECPLHQGLFDARTGMAKAAPATRALKMYESRVRDGHVQIKLSL